MLDVKSVFTQLLFSTTRLECELADGGSATGTAFFFTYNLENGKTLTLLVTNKHVVKGARRGRFWLHESSIGADGKLAPSASSFDVSVEDFENWWFPHPSHEIDLCVMPFQPLRIEAEKQGKAVYNLALTEREIATDAALREFTAMEDVVMVGYPIGLWDSTNNLPILRRGITASHPGIHFQGKPQGLVDMACFPGSSGSPILIAKEGVFSQGKGLVSGTTVTFLGILFAGPMHCADGTVEVVDIPTHSVAISRTTIPSHLGYYIKASALLELKTVLLKEWKL